MSEDSTSRGAEHFQRLYDADADPWRFRTSSYERTKYQRTIASLANRRYRSGLEVGCSIGVLTRMLAPLCDALLAVDIVEAPLATARMACADQPWVRFQQMQVPREWPPATFDLIVLSEVLYFLSPQDVATVAERAGTASEPSGVVLLVNWRGSSGDPCTGDEAANIFIDRAKRWLRPCLHYEEAAYRLDLLERRRLSP